MGKWVSAAVAAVMLLITLGTVPAQASQPGNSFTADNLPTWQVNGTVWAMTSAGGKVFAGGQFSQVRAPGTSEGDASSKPRVNLVVLDAATGEPTSCVLDVTSAATGPKVRALAASPDGSTVYIGGLFTAVNGVARTNLAAVSVSDCRLLDFNPGPSSFVYSIAATPNAVYFGGNFARVGTTARADLAAVSPSGALLPWAPKADDDVLGLGVDPNNGNVVVVGRSNTINAQESHGIAVVDGASGATVRAYPGQFIPWTPGSGQRKGTSAVKTLASDSTGFYIGAEGTGPGVFDGRAAFDWGTYDQRWRDGCLGATQTLVSYKGVVFGGSHSHDCETEKTFEDGARHHFTAETADSKQFLPWWPQSNDGIGEGIGPRASTVAASAAGDFLWYGGEFTKINGVAQTGLTRFGQTSDVGSPDPASTPNATSTVAGQATVTWRTTQDTDDKTLTYFLYRDASTTPIATLRADSEFYYHPQLSYTDTGLTPGTTYSYRVRASDGQNLTAYSNARSVKVASAANAYANRVAADGASVYFRMEEPSGTPASNAGSSATAGTYLNNPTRQAGVLSGRPDTSTAFDGTSSFLRTDVRQDAPSTYSLELWFKTTTTRGGRLVGFGNKALINGQSSTISGLSGSSDRQVYMSDDGTLTFGTTTGASPSTLSTTRPYNDGEWHQVVATQGSAGMTLFVDGNRLSRNTVTTALQTSGYWRIGGDSIGSQFPKVPTSNFIAANIDEAAVYPTVLTPAQVEDHYKLSGRSLVPVRPTDPYGAAVSDDDPSFYWRLGETSGTTAQDSVQNQNTGTYGSAGITRGVAGAVAGTSDGAVALNGTSSAIVSSDKSSSAPKVYSAEAWVRTTTTAGGKILGFGNAQTGSSTTYDRHLYLGNDGKPRFGVFTGAYTVLTGSTAINDGRWHHLVATQDTSGLKLYVDGAAAASSPVANAQTGTGWWRVGGDTLSANWSGSPTSKYLNGSVDEVAVYLKALTPAQVLAHRNLGAGQAVPDTSAPSAPTSATGSASAKQVSLSWAAASDDQAVAGYDVHRSTTAGFTPADSNRVGQTASTSLVDPNLAPGTYYYVVQARDAAGNVSGPSNQTSATVADTSAPTAPGRFASTGAAGSVQLTWDAATDDVGVTRYRVVRSTSAEPSADATVVAEVTSTSTVDTPPASGTYTYRVMALDAAGNASPPSDPTTAMVVKPDSKAPTAPTDLAVGAQGPEASLSWTPATDDVGVVRYDVHRSPQRGFTPTGSTKVGEASGTRYTDTGPGSGQWYYRVVAVDAAGNTGPASEDAGLLVDLAPPTAPANPSAKVSGSTVSLTWSASTDDTGVVSYQVHRSSSPGFTPSSTTLLSSTTDTGYSDPRRPAGTSYYRVVAVDRAEKTSDGSAEVSATVAAPERRTTTLSATEDAMVAQAAPTANYGSTASLASRGGSSAYLSYLKFEIPDAPAGAQLVSARLKVRTTSDDFAGSVDAHSVTLAQPGWKESTLVWNGRPSLSTEVGTTAKGTTKNQDLSVDLDTATVAAQGTGTLGLALTSTSGDNLWVWSRNSQVSSYRPVLVLEYEIG